MNPFHFTYLQSCGVGFAGLGTVWLRYRLFAPHRRKGDPR